MAGSSRLSSFYADHHAKGSRLGQSFIEENRKSVFCDWIGTGKSILDLGGRDGMLTRHFKPNNDVLLGDIDASALELASKNFGLKTIQLDLNVELPFDSNSFDVVVMGEVLEHLPYPKISLAEVVRVLKVGGFFIGSVPLAYHLKDRYNVLRGKKLLAAGDPTHLQLFKYSEAVSLLSDFFKVKEIVPLKGGALARKFPSLFARNIAFCCEKEAFLQR